MLDTYSDEDSGIDPSPPPELLFCTNCHWSSIPYNRDTSQATCFSPQNKLGVNLVDGSNVYKEPLCANQRSANAFDKTLDRCTTLGKWFKEKELRPVIDVTIGGQTGTKLELVQTKPKQALKRLTKEDLDRL